MLLAETLRLPICSSRESGGDYTELVSCYQSLVFRTAYRLLGRFEDAKDATQDVFLKLLKNHDDISGNPKGWLYRVTVNVCNDYYRRRIATEELSPIHVDPAPDPEELLDVSERRRLVLEGLEILTPRERAALVLRDIEGLTTADVASILHVEEVTVRGYIRCARLRLAAFVRSGK